MGIVLVLLEAVRVAAGNVLGSTGGMLSGGWEPVEYHYILLK